MLLSHTIVNFIKNEYLYHCKKCGKGFMSILGYKLHMKGHNEDERLPCEDENCEKTFGSKSAAKNT